jgi:hypothetical protein
MSIDEAIEELEGHEGNIRFQRLVTICEAFYGKARIRGLITFARPPGLVIHESTFRKPAVARRTLIRFAK